MVITALNLAVLVVSLLRSARFVQAQTLGVTTQSYSSLSSWCGSQPKGSMVIHRCIFQGGTYPIMWGNMWSICQNAGSATPLYTITTAERALWNPFACAIDFVLVAPFYNFATSNTLPNAWYTTDLNSIYWVSDNTPTQDIPYLNTETSAWDNLQTWDAYQPSMDNEGLACIFGMGNCGDTTPGCLGTYNENAGGVLCELKVNWEGTMNTAINGANALSTTAPTSSTLADCLQLCMGYKWCRSVDWCGAATGACPAAAQPGCSNTCNLKAWRAADNSAYKSSSTTCHHYDEIVTIPAQCPSIFDSTTGTWWQTYAGYWPFDYTNAPAGPYYANDVWTFQCLANMQLPSPYTSNTLAYTCQSNGQWNIAFQPCISLTTTSTAAISSSTSTSTTPSTTTTSTGTTTTTSTSTLATSTSTSTTSTSTTSTSTTSTSSTSTSTTSTSTTSTPTTSTSTTSTSTTTALAVGLCPPLYSGTGYITDALGEIIEPFSTNFSVGATYPMICNPGTTNPAGSSRVVYTCNPVTLQWSPAASGCNVYCPTFSVVNGYVQFYTLPTRPVGSAVYWTCNPGYIANGDDPVFCSSTLTWTYLVEPTCTSLASQLQNASNSLPTFLAWLVDGLSGGTVAPFHDNEADVIALGAIIADTLPYVLGGLTSVQSKQIGFTLPDILIDCAFAGVICKSSDFQYAQLDPQLGNCYTFNHKDMAVPYIEKRPGEEEGVYIVLSVRQEEYLDYVPSAGMRVIFHDPEAQVIPEVMGNDIAPGYLTQMRIYKTTINRISTPSSRCISSITDLASSTPFYYNGSYLPEACVRSIVQSAVVKTCGCASPMYALPPSNVAQSCQLSQLSCITNFISDGTLQSIASQVTAVECPELCSEVQFDVSRTFSLLSTAEASPYCQAANHSNMSCAKFTQSNLAMVRAFYSQLYHLTYTEYLALTAPQLVSSFGGLLGLCFGMSVIACVECVFCAYEAAVIIYKKLKGRTVTTATPPSGATVIRLSLSSNEMLYLCDEAKERKNILMSDVHGLRRVGTANSWWWLRLSWFVCMVASGSIIMVQLVNLVEDYEQFKTNIDITITEGELRFPAMTFCDLSPYKKSLLQNIGAAAALMEQLNQSPLG